MENLKFENPATANQIVKESITQALLKLMKKKEFSSITITELTAVAGVGRVSFYRNYESKEDVLEQYMSEVACSFWREHHEENPEVLWRMTFEIFELLKPTFLLIHKAQMDLVIYRFIQRCTGTSVTGSSQTRYQSAMFAGLVFGLLVHWLSTGAKETPEELTDMFREVYVPYGPTIPYAE